jgi:hypothetical protein
MRTRALLVALSLASCTGLCRPNREVTIHLTRKGRAEPGIDVVFSSTTGDVIAHAKTDADGEAGALVPLGGSITVATFDREIRSHELMRSR